MSYLEVTVNRTTDSKSDASYAPDIQDKQVGHTHRPSLSSPPNPLMAQMRLYHQLLVDEKGLLLPYASCLCARLSKARNNAV